MSHTVFILGAGASATAGAPCMAGFLDAAHDLLRDGSVLDKETQSAFREVFERRRELKSVHSNAQLDLNNIETLFAAFEMAATLGRMQALTQKQIESAIDSLVLLIATTIEQNLKYPVLAPNRFRGAPEPYGWFAKLLRALQHDAKPTHTVSVITFNYDVACDFALTCAHVPIDYGLGAADQVGNDALPLLKLHGSLNWARQKGNRKVQGRVVPLDLFPYCSDFNMRVLDPALHQTNLLLRPRFQELKTQGAIVDSRPVLVPPTWSKTDHHRGLKDVWSRAARELTDAENIFVIGYSFPPTDSFFQYLLALGTAHGHPLRRFWIYNPNTALADRFAKMLGPGILNPDLRNDPRWPDSGHESHFRFIGRGFKDAIVEIANTFKVRAS